MTLLISMFFFALVGAITPGPVNIIATSTGASFGFHRALPHVTGASIGYGLVVLLSGLGVGQILQTQAWIAIWLQYAGALFLLYLALKIASAPVNQNKDQDSLDTIGQPPSLWQGALCQWLNPKAWLVAVSGISLFVATGQNSSWRLTAFCLISLIVCFVSVGLWAALGLGIRRYLSTPSYQLFFNRAMGGLLAITVLMMFALD